MAAPEELTWNIVPPRRPTLDDLGSAQLEDHATRPPKPPRQPHAAQLNQWAKQLARLGGIVPVARFSVQFAGGNPSIVQFITMPTGPVLVTFTVTDNGPGDTSITWPADTFPASSLRPTVSINSDTFSVPRAFLITNGVRVKTADIGGILSDADFTVSVF
jgi:hypothetical protein